MLVSLKVLILLSSPSWLPLRVSGNVLKWVFQDLQPYQDIHVISDRNIDDLIQKNNISGKPFTISAFTFNGKNNANSGPNMKIYVEEGIERIFESTASVAIIVDLSVEKQIYDTLSYIGKSSAQLKTIHRIWIVVIWPLRMKNQEEIQSMKDSANFMEAVKPFRLNSHVFFAFNLATTAAPDSPASSSRGDSTQSKEEILVYEAYLAGNRTIFYLLQNGSLHLDCNYCEGIAVRRFNFHQRTLKVTAVNDSELNDDIHVYKDVNGTITYSKDGFSGSIHTILQQLLNFTTEPMLSQGFGVINPQTNRWEGAIGDVAEGKADLAMSITILQSARAEVVSFLPPADEHQINAFFIPSNERPIRDIFAQPFKPLLWAAVITTWIVLATCMIIFSMIRKRYGMDIYCNADDSSEDENSGHDFTNDSFIWALGTACQQGWDEHPKAGSLRAIFISGSFTGVVAYAGYSAAIVSTLSLRIDPIQNPLQLLNSDLHVGIRKGFISNLLEQKNSTDIMSHFYNKVSRSSISEQYLNVSSGLSRVLSSHPYAFITTRDTMYDLLKMTTDDKVICGIKDLPILKLGFPIGYAVPKFSPYREILRYALTMIREPGVLYRLRQRYSFKRRCLDGSENNTGYALGPNDVFTAFMILVAGFVLSISLMLVERIILFQKFPYVQ